MASLTRTRMPKSGYLKVPNKTKIVVPTYTWNLNCLKSVLKNSFYLCGGNLLL